jgi:tetratricopeptide (TPR) repeat protein
MADLSALTRLPFDTLAQFEAASGLMVLNLDFDAFEKSEKNYINHTPTPEDAELYSTINHETYHYFQTLATGYQYAYASEVWRLIVAEAISQQVQHEVRQTTKQGEEKSIAAQLEKSWKMKIQSTDENEAVALKPLLGNIEESSKSEAKRFTGFRDLVLQAQKARSWEDSAGRDFSLLAAELPSLAQGFDRLWAKIQAPGARGLSAEDLIEGSAVVFQHLLSYGREGLEERLANARDMVADTYCKALEVAEDICGARALDIVLPATALALRYANPPEAYVVLLEKLNACQPGHESSEAHAIGATPPQIEAAGEYLGTALDVRRKQARGDDYYPVYDDVLDRLEKREWGFDEIDLLSDRGPAQQIAEFPFVTVVKEGILRTNIDSTLLAKRVLCAALVLRSAKLPRYRLSAEQRVVDRLHAITAMFVDPLSSADEYNELGRKYLDEGDVDQARLMLEMALTLYSENESRKGIGWTTYNLGVVYAAGNNREHAQNMYRKALMVGEEIQDDELIARSANNLGDQYMKVDRLQEAENLVLKALAIQERLGEKADTALYCWNLGRIYYARKQMDRAREFFVRAVDLYRAVGDWKMVQGIEKGLAEMGKNKEETS